ncbi:MAG TPA: response regulator transcription factor [Rhodothermales bacterium]|nr:response regulator transcription factor [Rhodothermales bacterium]
MLIVDDDPDIRVALQDFFEMQGVRVTLAADGVEALERITQQPSFDIVLLDVMLPKKSGFEVLREARGRGVTAPVVVLTARNEPDMVLKGFNLGAIEYITKPFDADELSARVRAILSRTMPPSEAPMDVYQFGDVKVNLSTHEVKLHGERVPFSASEFGILQYFIHRRGETVSTDEIGVALQDFDSNVELSNIDRQVMALRDKIEPNPSSPTYIETVDRGNYRFNA